MKIKLPPIILVLTASALLSACQAQPVASSIRPATQAEMAAVKQEWIDKKCNAGLDEVDFVACATVSVSQMPVLDMSKREQFGERYDPKQWLECVKRAAESGKRGDGACEKFKVRRVENPEYWPNPNMPQVNWPTAPKEPIYRSWMSSRNYYEALCKAEAGAFIYKTVSDVEGVYLVRPMEIVYTGDTFDKYVSPAPYAGGRGFERKKMEFEFVSKGKYSFFEKPLKFHLDQYKTNRNALVGKSYFEQEKIAGLSIARYSGFTGEPIPGGSAADVYLKMEVEYTQHPKARYGLTWREIRRPADFEMEVVGSEIAIVDLSSGKILALTRDFVMVEQVSHGPNGLKNWSSSCPINTPRKNLYFFAEAVLKPAVNKFNN